MSFDWFKKLFSNKNNSVPKTNDIYDQRIKESGFLSENAETSSRGLKPHEILMIHYAPKYKIGNEKFQQFWLYDYGVLNPKETLNKVLQMGFITHGSSEDSLETLTVNELKNILLKNNLTQSGKKKDLIQRIVSNIDPYSLEKMVPCTNYKITALGYDELKQEEYVLYFHKHKSAYGLDLWEMNKLLIGYPHNLWRDRIWGKLQKEQQDSLSDFSKGNFQNYVFNCFQRCDFLIEEKRELENALKIWTEGIFYQIEFSAEKNYYREKESYKLLKKLNPDTEIECHVLSDFYIGDYEMDSLKCLQNYLNLTEKELYDKISEHLQSYSNRFGKSKDKALAIVKKHYKDFCKQ